MVSFTSDARRAWDWRNGTKVVAVLTAVAMLLAFIYQLAVGEVNLLGVGIYPATAILLLAITGDSRYRKDGSFPVPRETPRGLVHRSGSSVPPQSLCSRVALPSLSMPTGLTTELMMIIATKERLAGGAELIKEEAGYWLLQPRDQKTPVRVNKQDDNKRFHAYGRRPSLGR